MSRSFAYPGPFAGIVIIIVSSSVFFISSAANASGLGVSPPMITLNYAPGLNATYTAYVRNTESVPFAVNLTVVGLLKDYVKPSIDYMELGPNEKRYFEIYINLPDNMRRPGLWDGLLRAVQYSTASQGMVTALVGVEIKIFVRVPYPGEYLESVLSVKDVKVSEPVNFQISLISRGTENVTASGAIEIYDRNGRNMASLSTGEGRVETMGSAVLEASWQTGGVPPGKYFANSTVEYGSGFRTGSEAIFRIGDVLIIIQNVTQPGKITEGDIAKFNVTLESFWSEKFDNLFVEMQVLKDGAEVGSSKSESFTLDPYETESVTIFWDTGNLEKGEYTANFTVKYGQKVAEKQVQVNIGEPESYMWLYVILIVAAILSILTGVYLKKRKKRQA